MKTEYQIIPAQPGYSVILDVNMLEEELGFHRMPIVAWRIETDDYGGSNTSIGIPVTLFDAPSDCGIIEDPSGRVFCYNFAIEFDRDEILNAMWDAKSEDQKKASTIEWGVIIGAFVEDQKGR